MDRCRVRLVCVCVCVKKRTNRSKAREGGGVLCLCGPQLFYLRYCWRYVFHLFAFIYMYLCVSVVLSTGWGGEGSCVHPIGSCGLRGVGEDTKDRRFCAEGGEDGRCVHVCVCVCVARACMHDKLGFCCTNAGNMQQRGRKQNQESEREVDVYVMPLVGGVDA